MIAALLALAGPAHGQAWTRDAGSFYANASVHRIAGDQAFGPDRQIVDIVPYAQTAIGLYGEVGLIDRWLTVSAATEAWRVATLQKQGRTRGMGDSRIGLYSGLVTDPVRLTLGARVGIPTGDDLPSAGPGGDPMAEIIANSLPTGDGEWDVEPLVLFGRSFGGEGWPLVHFVDGSVGAWLRTRGFAHAITYKLQLGTKIPTEPLDRAWLLLRTVGVESFADDEEAAMSATGLGNGVLYTAIELELAVDVTPNFGIAASAGGAPRARSVVAAPSLRVGLYAQR